MAGEARLRCERVDACNMRDEVGAAPEGPTALIAHATGRLVDHAVVAQPILCDS